MKAAKPFKNKVTTVSTLERLNYENSVRKRKCRARNTKISYTETGDVYKKGKAWIIQALTDARFPVGKYRVQQRVIHLFRAYHAPPNICVILFRIKRKRAAE